MTKQYLGDAVYIDNGRLYGGLILTTEDGIEVTNKIFLEPEVLTGLLRYMVNTFGKETIVSIINSA